MFTGKQIRDPFEPSSCTQGRGASKTQLKQLLFDEFFKHDMSWGKSALYTLMAKTSNQTVERLQKEWVSWEIYQEKEGKEVAAKQKEQNLIQDTMGLFPDIWNISFASRRSGGATSTC
jgi:hypothetical protein